MSSSDSGMNGHSKEDYNDDATSSDGFGGVAPYIYDGILAFKKHGTFPAFCNQKENRNAHFHWRRNCKNFSVTNTGLLVYSTDFNSLPRAVVQLGEVRHVVRFIHEKIGHAGQKQTIHMCSRRLWWRSMRRDISRIVAECDVCRTRKAARSDDFQISASLPSSHAASQQAADDEDMLRAVIHRLQLVNGDGGLADEGDYFVQQEEDAGCAYKYMYGEEVGYGHHHLTGMDDSGLLVDEDEADVAQTLSSMNASYYCMQREGAIKIEDTVHHHDGVGHSSSVDAVYEDDPTMPMIVSDDFIPAASNEIVTTMLSPCLPLSPSDEDGLLMEEEEEQEEQPQHQQQQPGGGAGLRMLLKSRRAGMVGGRRRGEQAGQQQKTSIIGKKRLANGSSSSSSSTQQQQLHRDGDYSSGVPMCTSSSSKKQLMEENEALRGRLRQLEAAAVLEEQQQQQGGGAASEAAMRMPPVDEETAAIQKSVLIMQREVLVLQRAYWQSKLAQEGFDVQLTDAYYVETVQAPDGGGGSLEMEEMEGGEGTEDGHLHYEEEEELEEDLGHAAIGNVH